MNTPNVNLKGYITCIYHIFDGFLSADKGANDFCHLPTIEKFLTLVDTTGQKIYFTFKDGNLYPGIQIVPIALESHAMCLILIDDYIVMVNTGLGVDKNHFGHDKKWSLWQVYGGDTDLLPIFQKLRTFESFSRNIHKEFDYTNKLKYLYNEHQFINEDIQMPVNICNYMQFLYTWLSYI